MSQASGKIAIDMGSDWLFSDNKRFPFSDSMESIMRAATDAAIEIGTKIKVVRITENKEDILAVINTPKWRIK